MRWAVALLAAMLAGCGSIEVFTCEADVACVDGERQGVCEPSGFCSFPDPACASGKRHGEYAGEGLAGTCVESTGCDAECGPCETCEVDRCVVSPGAPCTFECGDFVSGLQSEGESRRCVAFAAGAGTGSCNEGGQCVPTEEVCSGAGAVLAECAEACAVEEHGCVAWEKAETITLAALCVTLAETPGCGSACVDGGGQNASMFTIRSCDATGMCAAEEPMSCGAYKCDGEACATSCTKNNECAGMASCAMGMCE